MRLEGTYVFTAPRADVWEALMDPTVLAGALPGGEQMEKVGDNDYRAVMNVKVGPVQGRFEGQVTLSDIVPLEQYTMKVDGQGAPGFLSGEGILALADEDGGGTLLSYAGDVQVGGRIANVGQRLIESTAKSMTRQGLAALDQMIQARRQPQPAETVVLPGEAARRPAVETPPSAPVAGRPISTAPLKQPSTLGIAGSVARDVAQDLASDFIPADKQERVVFFTLGALAMLAFVVLVRLVQRD
jgi:carbon monoxide dehydrogenase subunit G